jgi:sucrose-6-phosphate hydrolase SacC (GH32 family)
MSRAVFFFAAFTLAVTFVVAQPFPDPFYPIFHARPEQNWVNDPNGPMYDAVHDKYHLWMQYNPYGSQWGNMAWFHVVSDDLVFFKRLNVTLDRDQPYDQAGCWSGSVTFVNGNPVILYTCLNGSWTQCQCAAVPANRSDPELRVWNKVAGNPLLIPPTDGQGGFFRDPTTAWPVPNSTKLRFAVGTNLDSGTAAILLYDSSTLISNLTSAGVLHTNKLAPGGMYECPDYFNLTGMLPAGPQPPQASWYVLKSSHPPVNQDFFTLGYNSGDAASESFVPTCIASVIKCPANPQPGQVQSELVDFGKVYASKSFWDGKNQRRLWFGWIGEEDNAFVNRTWACAQTMPRVLSFDPTTLRIKAKPIPELIALREYSPETELAAKAVRGTALQVNNGLDLGINGTVRPANEFSVVFRVDKAVFDSTDYSEVGIDVLPDGQGHATFVGVSVDRSIVGPFAEFTWNIPPYISTWEHADATRCAAACENDPRCTAWSFNATQPQCNFMSHTPTVEMLSISNGMLCGSSAAPRFGVHRMNSGSSGLSSPHTGKAILLPTAGSTTTWDIAIRVFVDASFIEAFKDDGLERVAARIYNPAALAGASIVFRSIDTFPPGSVSIVEFEAYRLKSIWQQPSP